MDRDDPLRSLYNDNEVRTAISTYERVHSGYVRVCERVQGDIPEDELLLLCEMVGWSVEERHLLKHYIPPESFITLMDPRGACFISAEKAFSFYILFRVLIQISTENLQRYDEFLEKTNFVEVRVIGDGDCFFRALAIALVVRGVIPKPRDSGEAHRYINAARASLVWSLYMSRPSIVGTLVRSMQNRALARYMLLFFYSISGLFILQVDFLQEVNRILVPGRYMSDLTDVLVSSATEVTGLGINILTRRVREDKKKVVSYTMMGRSWVQGMSTSLQENVITLKLILTHDIQASVL